MKKIMVLMSYGKLFLYQDDIDSDFGQSMLKSMYDKNAKNCFCSCHEPKIKMRICVSKSTGKYYITTNRNQTYAHTKECRFYKKIK